MGNQPSLLSVLTEMCHRDGSTQLCSLICDQHHGEESNWYVMQHKPSKCYCFYKSLEIVTAAPVLEYLLPTANFSEKQYMNCLNLMVLAGNQLVDLTIHLFPEKTKVDLKCCQPLWFCLQTNRGLFFSILSQTRNKKSDHYFGSLGISVRNRVGLFTDMAISTSHSLSHSEEEVWIWKRISLSAVSHLS